MCMRPLGQFPVAHVELLLSRYCDFFANFGNANSQYVIFCSLNAEVIVPFPVSSTLIRIEI